MHCYSAARGTWPERFVAGCDVTWLFEKVWGMNRIDNIL